MRYKYFLIFILFAQSLAAQNLKGKIVDAAEKPISNVSVYIDGSKSRTYSDENGNFLLDYKMLTNSTIIFFKEGYKQLPYPLKLMINKQAKVILEREHVIQEVVLVPFTDKDFEVNYARFKQLFLGEGQHITIKNKKDILFAVDREKRTFLVKAKKPLIILNRELGYEIEYNLLEFVEKSDTLTYAGTSFFKDLDGSKSNLKKWEENRKEIYLGSPMHFFRSLFQNMVTENKFVVNRAKTLKNENYPTELELQKLADFSEKYRKTNLKSILVEIPADIQTIINKKNNNKEYYLSIYKTKIPETEYSKWKAKDLYLSFDDLLQIVYIKEDKKIVDTLLNSTGNEFVVYPSGTISDPTLLLFNGTWAKYNISKMLPLDFHY